MVAIPFPISTAPGQRPQEGAGRLVNVYADARGENIGAVWHRVPGMRIFGSSATDTWTAWSFPFEEFFAVAETPSGAGLYRGGVVVGDVAYVALGTTVYQLSTDGGLTALSGTLSGTDKVHMARNNAVTPDVVIVCDAGAFIVSGTTITAYPDGDVGSPNSVCFHDGYFMFGYGDGTIQASGVNATSIDPLDFTTAESNPDGLTRVFSFRGQLYACGPATIEVYGDPINPSAFPLTRKGYNITPGLITPFAIAGFEPEWGFYPIYCASNNTVVALDVSWPPTKISTSELDALIAAVEDKSTLEALCYVSKGHPMWQLSCDDWTWVYDVSTKSWHERKSYLLDRSRMSLSLPFSQSWLFGDTQSNSLLELDEDLVTEDGNPLAAQIESGPVKDFPNRVRVARADFDFVVGVGDAQGVDPIGTDPQVLVSWSDDGGYSWTTPWWRDLGAQAESQQRVTVINTGMSGPMGRRWRLLVSDPVWFGLMAGDQSAEVRAK